MSGRVPELQAFIVRGHIKFLEIFQGVSLKKFTMPIKRSLIIKLKLIERIFKQIQWHLYSFRDLYGF